MHDWLAMSLTVCLPGQAVTREYMHECCMSKQVSNVVGPSTFDGLIGVLSVLHNDSMA